MSIRPTITRLLLLAVLVGSATSGAASTAPSAAQADDCPCPPDPPLPALALAPTDAAPDAAPGEAGADQPVSPDASPVDASPATDAVIDAGPLEHISVSADRFTTSVNEEGQRLLTASGRVRAVITDLPEPDAPAGAEPRTAVILADSLTVNVAAREALAEGKVTLYAQERVARGERLEYRWVERTGRVEDVEFRQYGLAFRAEALELEDRRLVIYDASFSTCGLDDPEYLISARRVEIIPNRRIVAHDIGIEIFERRIIRLPRLEYRIEARRARARRALPVLRPGYSSASGFSLAQPLPLGRNLDAEAEITTRAGIRGLVAWDNAGRVSPYALASWKQEEPARDRRPVFVSRLPQVGLRFGTRNEVDVSAGFFREHSTRTEAGRLEATVERTLLDRGDSTGLTLRLGGRGSWYTTGSFYRVLRAEASVGWDGPDTFTEAGFRLNGYGGSTPFLWDAVQVPTELFAVRRTAVGRYRLESGIRYDLERGKVYDFQVAAGKRFRCLEPEIRYSTRRRGISFNLRVFGLEDERAAVPEPVAPPPAGPIPSIPPVGTAPPFENPPS